MNIIRYGIKTERTQKHASLIPAQRQKLSIRLLGLIHLTSQTPAEAPEQAQEKKYTFKVAKDANKTEVKQAVEAIFDVEVEKVNIMNVNGKLKRMGRTMGRRAAYKKAIVTLTAGSKEIEFFQSL